MNPRGHGKYSFHGGEPRNMHRILLLLIVKYPSPAIPTSFLTHETDRCPFPLSARHTRSSVCLPVLTAAFPPRVCVAGEILPLLAKVFLLQEVCPGLPDRNGAPVLSSRSESTWRASFCV